MNAQPWYIYALFAVAAALILRPLLFRRSPKDRAAVLEKIKSGAKIIDVRTPGEFSGGHYKGAKNIPLQELQQRVGEVGPKDKPVVVYCQSGGRSAMAARLLRSSGFTDVTNGGGLSDMP